MKNSHYRTGRNRTIIALIALWLLLPLVHAPLASGQRRTKKTPATTAKKPGTRSTQSAAPSKTTNASETGAADAPADTTKPGTVMSNQLDMEFVYVPSGSFVMGSDKG